MPLVSVWITTYNHEKFISEAIESVLDQNVSFDYEIIIGEDCSADNTREIVKKYQNKFPGKIRLFLPEKNIGMISMFMHTYRMCTGKYIAWLDGDDYWSDPDKLQRQVDFMESHPDYVLCFHKVTDLDLTANSRNESSAPNPMGPDSTLNVNHFLQIHNPVYAVSVFHRNILGKQLPEWFYDLPSIDFGFYFLLLEHGKAKFLNKNMAVYRIHKGGAWSGQNKRSNYNSKIGSFKILKENLTYLPEKRVNQLIASYYFKRYQLDLTEGSIVYALLDLKEIARYDLNLMIKNKRLIFSSLFKKLLMLPKRLIFK